MIAEPLSALQVIAVRYRGVTFADGDERALDAYAKSGVYQTAQTPVDIFEPRFPGTPQSSGQPRARSDLYAADFGRFNHLIADQVAVAQRAGKSILMSGGDCTHITGILGGLQAAHGPTARIGLVWFDAHGDFNTPQTTISGNLGGMPVAVCAGLAFPTWREGAGISAPLPTDRIMMVDVRNLDPAEAQLIEAVGIPIAAVAPGFPGAALHKTVADLAERVDMFYLHIDADILDASFVPDHSTGEPNGPDMGQVLAAVDAVMAAGKVVAYAVVSIYAGGAGRERSVASGIELIRSGLESWRRHGMPVSP